MSVYLLEFITSPSTGVHFAPTIVHDKYIPCRDIEECIKRENGRSFPYYYILTLLGLSAAHFVHHFP